MAASHDRTYYPAFDGIRALAVIAVIVYHAGDDWLPGGFLGVDVFFVLSGFLITSLLLDEHARADRIDRIAFLWRRARRLLPALGILLLGIVAYSAFVAVPPERGPLRLDALATLAYVANWRFIFADVSYFGAFGPPSPLRHVWSLAIEEQYYLVWPFLVAFVLARFGRGRLLLVTGALALASAVLAVLLYTPAHDPSRVYYGTDTRAQALLIGSALGIVFAQRERFGRLQSSSRARHLGGWVGFLVLFVAFFAVRDSSTHLYRGGLTLVAIAAALLVQAAAVQERTPLVRALSVKPLVWIGLISYGLYLFHWPIVVWLTPQRTSLDGVALFALRVALTLAVAVASFYLVERPVRQRRWHLPRGALLRPFVPVAIAGVLVIAIIASTAGTTSWNSYVTGVATRHATKFKPQLPRVLTVGDSSAFTLAYNIDAATDQRANWRGAQELGCGIMRTPFVLDGQVRDDRGGCDRLLKTWQSAIRTIDPDLVVMVAGPWEVLDQYIDGKVARPGSPAYNRALHDATETAIDTLSARGARVVFMDIPCFGPSGTRGDEERTDPARRAAVNRVLESVAASDPRLHLITWSRFLCPGNEFTPRLQGVTIRPDGVHFDADGAHVVWAWLGPKLLALADAAHRAREAQN